MTGYTPIYNLPYPQSSDLVSAYPATGQDLAEEVETVLAAKAALAGATYTGTHNFTSATVTGIPAGLSIITPTSIANSGGTASASGGAVNFTTVNSISVNGVFSATYDNYLVLLVNSSSAGTGSGEALHFRYRASGTDTTTGYVTQRIYAYSTTLGAMNTITTGQYIAYMGHTEIGASEIFIYGPNLASYSRYHVFASYPDSTTTTQINLNGGVLRNSTQYDGMTIYPPTGTITGTVRIYGLKNS